MRAKLPTCLHQIQPRANQHQFTQCIAYGFALCESNHDGGGSIKRVSKAVTERHVGAHVSLWLQSNWVSRSRQV